MRIRSLNENVMDVKDAMVMRTLSADTLIEAVKAMNMSWMSRMPW